MGGNRRSGFYERTVGSRPRGRLSGKTDNKTRDELRVIEELLERGYNVKIIPESRIQDDRTPDLAVNSDHKEVTLTEIKTLHHPNTNTGCRRVKDAIKQNAQNVIIDARKADITKEQADEIVNRARGSFPDKKLPINVEILTNEGSYYYIKDI